MRKTDDWPVKKVITDLPIRVKENSKCASGILLSPLGTHNKDLGAASQTLLARERLRQCDADYLNYPWGKNDSSDNFLFYINWMFNLYTSYFSFSKIFVKRANSVPTS